MEKQLKDYRAAVKNVLDWGLDQRRKAINRLLRTIYERYKETKEAAKDKGKSAEAASGGKDQPPASNRKITIDSNCIASGVIISFLLPTSSASVHLS